MIELILNLSWLMLALPAYWVWRREMNSVYSSRRSSSARCVLVLGCILALLFPVVSATDDLHLMRPEMEESGPSKRTLKHSEHDRTSHWLSGPIAPPAQTVAATSLNAADRLFGLISVETLLPVCSPRFGTPSSRAPPTLIFA